MRSNEGALRILHAEMRACRRCLEAGFSILPGTVFSGRVTAVPVAVTTGGARIRPFSCQALLAWIAPPGYNVTYCRGMRAMNTNYAISTQLVDEAQCKTAQHDGWPLGRNAPVAAEESAQTLTDACH